MTEPQTRRDRQADQTRADILDAALRLFVSRGYGVTSVSDIAAEAGVAVPTIYASVGAKPTLLRQLVDRIDELGGVGPAAAGIVHGRTGDEVVRAVGTLTRQLAERAGDIVTALASAAAVEEELGRIYTEGMRRHRAGCRLVARRLATLGALGDGVETEHAAAVIAALTHHTSYDTLHRDWGWSFDDCQAWVERSITTLLRPPD